MNDLDYDGTADEFFFNGRTFPSHQVARECQLEVPEPPEGPNCLAPSTPNQAFANLSSTAT